MVSSVVQGGSKNRLQILPLKSVFYFLCSILVVLLVLACIDRILLPDLARKGSIASPEWVEHNKRVYSFMAERNLGTASDPLWRSEAFQVSKSAEGMKRILVIGDSFAWGDGLENMNDIWWRQLQIELLRRGFQNVQVIGAGACGAPTNKELVWAKKLNEEYSPDAIVFGYVANDPDEGGDTAGSGFVKQLVSGGEDQVSGLIQSMSSVFPNLSFQLNRLRDGKLISKKSGPAGYEYKVWQEKLLEGENWKAYENTVAGLGAFAKESGKPVFSVALPLPTADASVLYNPIEKLYRSNGVPFLNLFDGMMAWTAERSRSSGAGNKSLAASPVNGHPALPLTHFYATSAADFIEKNYKDILGPKTASVTVAKEPEINDFIPPLIACKKTNTNTYTMYYPTNAKDFLQLPLQRPYIQLNLAMPVSAKSIHIAGKSLASVSLAVRAGDPSKYADTVALKDFGTKKGNECNFKLPDNTVIDEVLLSAELDGPNNMILVQFNQ